MTMRRFLTLFAAVVLTAPFVQAQLQISEFPQDPRPTFKQHRIGESAQEFFSIAKMTNKNGMLSADYCRAYLDDPKVKRAVEKAKKKGGDDDPSSAATMDVEGCRNIKAALAGQDVEVGTRYATEFGSGSTQFIAGRLSSVSFVVQAPFSHVVEDMTAKLNARPQQRTETLQNAVGAIVNLRRAAWTLPNTLVKVSELQSVEGSDIGTSVSVSDPTILKHRANSLN